MNKNLPKKDQLKPITDPNNTFYHSGFNKEFDLLSFEQKLQVVNDLVRQSILTESDPHTENSIEELKGNCHTAALASMEYLKYLGLGKNYKYVLCQRRAFDPYDLTTRHVAALVDDEEGNTYFYDATPFVGYGFGRVINLSKEKVYEEYEVLEDDKFELMYFIREFSYKARHGKLKEEELPFYKDVFNDALKYPAFKGSVSYCYKLLSKLATNNYKKDEYLKKVIELNPYYKLNPNFSEVLKRRKELLDRQVEIWTEELNDLIASDQDPKRQLMLAQYIYQEKKMLDDSLEEILEYNGNKYFYSGLTPRFFSENGLNSIMIKASAYNLGVRGTIREAFLKRGKGVLDEYFVNLAQPTKVTGITPLIFSHPSGSQNLRAYSGTSDVILIKERADKLSKIKKRLRSELGKNIVNREVMWNDGEKILWHPFLTNLIHSTDNPSEANLHFLIGKPEHQVMTRFMYPNKNLEEENENERT